VKRNDKALRWIYAKYGRVVLTAKLCGIPPTSISAWTRVPSRHLTILSVLTGIPARELRPDVFERQAALRQQRFNAKRKADRRSETVELRQQRLRKAARRRRRDTDAVVRRLRAQRGWAARAAKACGITRQSVVQWSRVPACRVSAISKLTGLPQHRIRPDVFPRE
jgi:hypothetical protein